MKNIMKNNNILSALTAVLFVTSISFGAFGFAPAAHAQYDSSGDYSGGCCGDAGYSYSSPTDYGSSYSTPTDYGTSYTSPTDYGYSYSSPTDYGTSYSSPADYGYSYSSPADYGYSYSSPTDYGSSYSTPSYSTPSYSTSGYSTGGYSTGGYSTGGYSTGGGYMIGGGYGYNTPVVASAPSNTYAPTTVTDTTTTNTCTGNSCNHDDHSVVNITNPAPVINNNNVVANYAPTPSPVVPVQQYCQSGYSGTYPNCYRPQPVVYQQPPVAYNTATPYVSLSQVPYTGLDLGFWGSIAYWGAFVLFALFAAYLIAIKRVQNTIANYLKSTLFGSDEEVHAVTTTGHVVTAPSVPAPAPEMEGDVIDSFIMSQINRARHA